MDEKDKKNQKLTQDVGMWKNRALEAAEKACFNCEEYTEDRKKCEGCRIMRIMEEASK